MKKTIAYVRVSTSEQATEGVSLEMQGRKITSYCDVKDWTLDEVITDEGESAKSLNRPGVTQLIHMVEAGQVATILVYKLDRLTRSVADLDRLVKLFERKGVAPGEPSGIARRHNRYRPVNDESLSLREPVGA
jgi:site-specific DNA recombinase